MKYPRTVKSATIIGDFKAIIEFDDGSSRLLDFTQLELKGAFAKLKTDRSFFNTLKVKHGYVMWDGDLTIDSDFLYDNGEKTESMPATGYVHKIEYHYNK